MLNESMKKRILQLHVVERLTFRQIALHLGISKTSVAKVINPAGAKIIIRKPKLLESYRSLIGQWYKEYPKLKAKQVYERLQTYGYNASYETVAIYTRELRKKNKPAYHSLEFLPGEEAQVDWVTVTNLSFGKVYGFIYVLSYSRYAWGKFYPRNSFEFFLDGHIECFNKINGVPHKCRYDNLKSVVITRVPYIKYNPQFLDFSRFYGFGIYLCNPYSGNEKGRVERIIRDIRSFLYSNAFRDIKDLNNKFWIWLGKRNNTIHRTTLKKPEELVLKEKLISLPGLAYQAGKITPVLVSSTGWIEFDTNKYSVPSTCSNKKAELIVYPDKVIVMIKSSKVATHKRSFLRKQKIENPLHREYLLNRTPTYKYKRILQLMKNMDGNIALFLDKAKENGEDNLQNAYQLFKLLKLYPRSILIDCVQKACSIKAYRIKTILSLLHLPEDKNDNPVYPQDTGILDIRYEERRLEDYDELI